MATRRHLDKPVTQVRRRDRTLTDAAWIDRLLHAAPVGHAAVVWQEQPLIHSNLFWYDGQAIYWHTASVGHLRAILDLGDLSASFTVTEFGRLLPAGTPLDFSIEYASVILYGTVGVVQDPHEKRRALEGLMSKYAPHLAPDADYVPMPDSDIAITSVHRFVIAERVAKHNIKPDDYRAYTYMGESIIDAERAAGRITLKE